MTSLKIFLFGSFHLGQEGQPPSTKLTHGVQALFAYLLLQRNRCHPREALAGLFWGNQAEEKARKCLNTALWRLRSALEPEDVAPGTYLTTTASGEIGFNRESRYWLDVAAFETQASHALARPATELEAAGIQELEQAVQLYTGDLLEGFYDDWALRERERLRHLYLSSLTCLMRYYRHHHLYESSLAYGRQVLQHDPLREEIHREMMRLYLESGQRSLAIQQYETCCEVLAQELGIPPMEETQALYHQILPHAPRPIQKADRGHASIIQQLQNLRRVIRQLDETCTQIEQAAQNLEQQNHKSS